MAAWWKRLVRPQDVVWLVLFSALAILSPTRTSVEIVILSVLAVFQVAEPRIAWTGTPRGRVGSILLKLTLGYLLIGFTGGINSSYYLILLLPVVSAATTLGGVGGTLLTATACLAYLSQLLFVDWTRYSLPPEAWRELSLRIAFLGTVGYLTHVMAEANRVQARRYQAVAEQLAEANRNLRAAEAAYRRTERLAALGQLSAGLAHEIRNPLGTITASAEVLRRKVPAGDEVAAELAGFICSEVDRANTIITRFLQFARPLVLRPRRSDLAETIDRAVSQLERVNPKLDVAVYRNYSPDIAPFHFDPELMESVFYNLLLNAAQASPSGGTVTVKTRRLDSTVEIAVIDRGAGIDPRNTESVFNPFFTTKPDGVGLGLAIVSKVVDEHGGKLALESELGKGSVFRVYLPSDRFGAEAEEAVERNRQQQQARDERRP